MRVLLISANTEQLPDPVFPIGAAYMATVAEQHGHTVETFDCCFASDPQPALTTTLRDFAPDVVGISLRNLDSSAYPQNTSYIDDYRAPGRRRARADAGADRARRRRLHGDARHPHASSSAPTSAWSARASWRFPWVLERLAARRAARARRPRCAASRSAAGVCVTPTARIKPARRRRRAAARALRLARLLRARRRAEHPDQARLRLRVRLLQLPADRGGEGAHAQPGGGGRRDRGGAARHRRAPLVLRRQHLQPADPPRQGDLRASSSRASLDIEWSGYLNPKFIDDELCALMARSGCRRSSSAPTPGSPTMIANLQQGVRRSTTCAGPRACATSTASSSATA